MIEIIFYKTSKGIYIADKNFSYSGRKVLNKSYIYNEKDLSVTHSKSWFFLEGESELKTIKESLMPPRELTGFILKDDSLESDKIPLELSKEQVKAEYDSDEHEYFFGNQKYSSLRPLYKEVYYQPVEIFKNVEFKAECLGELSIEPADYSIDDKYRVPIDSNYDSKGTKEIDLSTITRYDEFEEMLTPEFLLYTRPCYLTSEQTYKIIRQYVKDNINSKTSLITSDYSFCFTVSKKISLKPYLKAYEEKNKNGKSYARPKIYHKKIEYIEKEIFEMTHKGENYKNYTPISGFKGDSLADLAENIKLYLDELMYFINEPVSECEHCNGTGHIIKKFCRYND